MGEINCIDRIRERLSVDILKLQYSILYCKKNEIRSGSLRNVYGESY